MIIFYRFIINLVFIFSPIILVFRLLYKKEDPNWEAYQRWQGWMRAKSRNAGRKNNHRRN